MSMYEIHMGIPEMIEFGDNLKDKIKAVRFEQGPDPLFKKGRLSWMIH